MQSYRKLRIGEAWRSLAPGQGFRVVVIGGALLVGAAGLGAFLQGGHDHHNLGRKQDRVATLVGGLRSSNGELERRYADLIVESGELRQRYAALEASLAASRADRRALAGETEFLNRYIAYEGLSHGAGAKSADPRPLIDALCSLWKSNDRQFTSFESSPLRLSPPDFDQGRVSSELQTLLVENFVSLDPIQQIRLASSAQPSQGAPSKAGKPRSHQALPGNSTSPPPLASIIRQAQAIKVLKSVTYLDGARYEIPKNIAIALQIRRECLPR